MRQDSLSGGNTETGFLFLGQLTFQPVTVNNASAL